MKNNKTGRNTKYGYMICAMAGFGCALLCGGFGVAAVGAYEKLFAIAGTIGIVEGVFFAGVFAVVCWLEKSGYECPQCGHKYLPGAEVCPMCKGELEEKANEKKGILAYISD